MQVPNWPMYDHQGSISRISYVRRQLQLFAKLYVDAAGAGPQYVPWYYAENCTLFEVCRSVCLTWCSQEVLTEICSLMADSWARECNRRYQHSLKSRRSGQRKGSWTGNRAAQRAQFLRAVGLLRSY